MIHSRFFKLCLSIVAFFVLAACNEAPENTEQESDMDALMSQEEESAAPEVSEEMLSEIIQGIPSPVEIVALIKGSGAEYSEDVLNPTDNLENYTTNYQHAFNLGVYGADLGYINVYEKTMSALGYLNAVKSMADEIKVGQFFDFETLKRLSSNKENMDSLLNITTSNFNRMDYYLREQGRSNLSVLSVAGAWLEGLYITAHVAESSGNAEIIERLGEQKIPLADLVLLLSQYSSDPSMSKIHTEFEKLSVAFEAVEFQVTEAEPITKEVDGRLVIEDQSTSTIVISDEALANIIKTTYDVRNTCIN